MFVLAFFHPGNPNLLELYGLLAGILLFLFVIDRAIDFFKTKPWKKIDAGSEQPSIAEDSGTDPQQHSLPRSSIA
ncbi:MAG: hypothetical protein HY033_06350 [Ignavibacteriae bacterium]|nr:hypothetical protein [Ignavibacteria bacterium]MBI3364513.1 hypothetical protein [Ignavibacteriota bacterium]